MQISEPIRLPTLDKLEEPKPGIDKKKEVLAQTDLFKKVRAKAKLRLQEA